MGKLIVIEGLDGSGKGTQTKLLCERLTKEGVRHLKISLPHYDEPSSALVKQYLGGEFGAEPGDVNAFAASAFYAVDRYAGYKKLWGEAYETGALIVADRYTTSNACHQMTKLKKEDWDAYLDWLDTFEFKLLAIPKPDLVLFLDMPVEVSQRLLQGRYQGDDSKKDLHERNRAYLAACHEAAKYAAEKCGWHTITCSENGAPKPIEQIAEEIFSCVKDVIDCDIVS